MTYDEKLAARVRRVTPPIGDIVEKKMFGGLAFLLDGKMFMGITNGDLMVRVGADGYEDALARPHARPMDFTGRPLTGYVYVSPAGSRTDAAVAAWVQRSMRFVQTLPATKKKPKPRPRANRNLRKARATTGAARRKSETARP